MIFSVRPKSTLLCLAIALCASQLGCGPLNYQIPSSQVAPGADAKLEAKVQEARNQTLIDMKVQNLIPPARAMPDAAQYVAWYRRDQQGMWTRIATLEYDEDDRTGKLSGSVPETAFDLEVSSELAGTPASPSPTVLFAQHVQKD